MKNAAKVEQNAIFLLQARPVATPTIFCSAIKHSIKFSGYFSNRVIENVLFLVSPSNPITCEFDSLAFNRAVP
jgi:hypothetical protein